MIGQIHGLFTLQYNKSEVGPAGSNAMQIFGNSSSLVSKSLEQACDAMAAQQQTDARPGIGQTFSVNIPGIGPSGVNPVQVNFLSKEGLACYIADVKEMEERHQADDEIITSVLDRAATDGDSAALTVLGALACNDRRLWPLLDSWLKARPHP